MYTVFQEDKLFVYPDLASAISYFFSIQKGDVSIQPNVNKSFNLLAAQNHLYSITDFCNIPIESILNIGIVRDDELQCCLRSALLCLSPDQIKDLSKYYKIYTIKYAKKQCALCHCQFKIHDINSDYYGCIYNPVYYQVITPENLETYHLFGCDLKNTIVPFYLNISGRYQGLLASKNPLPDNIEHGSYICWSCMTEDDYTYVWSH